MFLAIASEMSCVQNAVSTRKKQKFSQIVGHVNLGKKILQAASHTDTGGSAIDMADLADSYSSTPSRKKIVDIFTSNMQRHRHRQSINVKIGILKGAKAMGISDQSAVVVVYTNVQG